MQVTDSGRAMYWGTEKSIILFYSEALPRYKKNYAW